MARSGDRDVNKTAGRQRASQVWCIETLRTGGELAISGQLDVHSVPDVRLALGRAIEEGSGELLLHLGEAEIGDATGLGVIVGAHHRAQRAGRRLVLVDASARLERLLRATKLIRVIPLIRPALRPAVGVPA